MTQTLRSNVVSGLAALALALGLVFAAAAPSQAQVQQDGLVNVNVGDVLVQLPIAVAANVCDVAVNVLAQQLGTGDATCDAVAESEAVAPPRGNSGNTNQSGLVNVNLGDITVQAPIGVAANICDVAVNVLARSASLGDATCDASALSDATG